MATATSLKNTLIEKKKEPAKQTFSSFLALDTVQTKINATLGDLNGKRFVAAILSAVSTNPALQECEHGSIISAALLGESLQLSPSPQLGQYYLVPYSDTKRGIKTATFQIGYKGYLQLAIRSGQYERINVVSIKEGELISYDPLEEELKVKLIEDEELRYHAPTMGYYAFFKYSNGFKKSVYWSKNKMESHALKYSQGYKSDKQKGTSYTFWSKDFDNMAHKTLIRQLISKWGIMSIDMQQAIEKDYEAEKVIEGIEDTKIDAYLE